MIKILIIYSTVDITYAGNNDSKDKEKSQTISAMYNVITCSHQQVVIEEQKKQKNKKRVTAPSAGRRLREERRG